MQVVLLTEEQYQEIEGKKFAPDYYFLPLQDKDGNWTVGIFEQKNCTHPDFQWIKKCPSIEYKPKPIEIPEIETPVQE